MGEKIADMGSAATSRSRWSGLRPPYLGPLGTHVGTVSIPALVGSVLQRASVGDGLKPHVSAQRGSNMH